MRMLLPVRMVWRQLRYELLTPLCLCIAMAAALVPLLMILGLKEGYVNTLRQRLASEPANLEVSIPTSETVTPQMVQNVRGLPEVGFCIPGTRILSVDVKLRSEHNKEAEVNSGLVPTGEGDPLLARYELAVPRDGEILLAASHAAALNVKTGDTVQVFSSRTDKSGRVRREGKLCRVVGIFPVESGCTSFSYVPLSHVEAVEEFKEGLRDSLTERRTITINPVYLGVWLDKAEAKNSIPGYQWRQACPFTQERPATEAEVQAGHLAAGGVLFSNPAQFVTRDKLRHAYQLVTRKKANLYLWNPSMRITLKAEGRQPLAAELICEPEQLSFKGVADTSDVVLRCGDASAAGTWVVHTEDKGSIVAQVQHHADLPAGEWRASASALGVLRLVKERGLVWNAAAGVLTHPSRSYSRLRVYARDIDAVEPLVLKLNEMGFPATGKLAEIQRIRQLNEQLERLFYLIAAICFVGTALSLGISLFNSARKRKRDYAILSTMGFSRKSLTTFPLYESVLLTLAALGLSFGLFHGVSYAISQTFADQLRSGEVLCYLTPQQYLIVSLCGIGTGLLSSLVAAVSVLYTQPSIAIREV